MGNTSGIDINIPTPPIDTPEATDQKLIINKSTLTGIADAIRDKDGSTNPIKVSDMATAISEIPGGDVDASALTTNEGRYLLTDAMYGLIKDNNLERYVTVTVVPETGGTGAAKFNFIRAAGILPFSTSDVNKAHNDMSFVKFDCTGSENNVIVSTSIAKSSNDSIKPDNLLLKFPTVINKTGKKLFIDVSTTFMTTSPCYSYMEDVDEYVNYMNNFDGIANKSGVQATSSAYPDAFTKNNTILDNTRIVDKYQELIDGDDTILTYSGNVKSGSYGNVTNARILKLAVLHGNAFAAVTSDLMSGIKSGLQYTKSIKFCIDKVLNQPYEVKWKNQNLDLSGSVGWYNGTSLPTGYDYKQVAVLVPLGNTIESATAAYNQYKSNPYYYIGNTSFVQYDGKTINLAKLFSLFNHDSAVELINSLPDCSAYLATAGGTNTLKLARYNGALTDGGGCGDLTADEIAVATNKGWTITFAD